MTQAPATLPGGTYPAPICSFSFPPKKSPAIDMTGLPESRDLSQTSREAIDGRPSFAIYDYNWDVEVFLALWPQFA